MNPRESKAVLTAVIEQPKLVQELTRNGFDWSSDLSALIKILQQAFSKYSPHAERDAFLTTFQIADALGGGQFYLPRADAVKTELRTILIQQEFNGKNQSELMNKFGISQRTLNTALARNIRKSKPELLLKSPTQSENLSAPAIDDSWPQGILSLCNVIRESLLTIGIHNEEAVINIALGITRSFGGRQRYFPKSTSIERYFLERHVFLKRQEGLKVRDIARMYGITKKNVYDICTRLKAKQQDTPKSLTKA
jgi:Mor family transcriptional regulator